MYCRFCGNSIPNGVKFCPECGGDLSVSEKTQSKNTNGEKNYYVSSKSKTTAVLLCMLGFLGFGGIHRMYVGKWATGALYAMSFGVLFIGTLYDLCMLYYEKFKDSDGYPLFGSGSMKKNYKLRTPKDDTHIVIKFVAVFCLLITFGNIILAFTKQHTYIYKTTVAEQKKMAKDEKEAAQKEERQKRDELRKERDKILSDKQRNFDKIMSQYPCYDSSGRAGNELQVIVNEQWASMTYHEKVDFVVNATQARSDCNMKGDISYLSFRYNLDGKKLAEFDSDGTHVYH